MTVVVDDSVNWVADQWLDPDSHHDQKEPVHFLSFPFDQCVSHRPGTRHGPSKILECLNSYGTFCVDRREELSDALGFVNHGQVPANNQIHKYYRKVIDRISALPSDGISAYLGGDHSIADPIFRGEQARLNEGIGLLLVDAHFDSRPPTEGTEHSGHWVYTLQDALDHGAMAHLGANASIYSQAHLQDAEERGVYTRTVNEARQLGAALVVDEAIKHIQKVHPRFHVSIDIDVIDQAFCPGTSVPNPCGLLPHDVADMLYTAGLNSGFTGFDIVEVSPPLDQDDRTSDVAAQLILHALAGVALRSRTTNS